eukprot:515806-Prymnesium_polylepis.1
MRILAPLRRCSPALARTVARCISSLVARCCGAGKGSGGDDDAEAKSMWRADTPLDVFKGKVPDLPLEDISRLAHVATQKTCEDISRLTVAFKETALPLKESALTLKDNFDLERARREEDEDECARCAPSSRAAARSSARLASPARP